MTSKKTQFILSIGDEGGILTHTRGGEVLRRLYAPTANYADTKAFIEAFESDPKATISMLVDVMDQSYLQQTLPPVSPLTINNLIKRKMERDFAAEDLKGALRIGREKEGRKDWKYLFVTLSRSPQLDAWIDMVLELKNPFSGIYLLPVEAESFIRDIHQSIHGKPSKKDPGLGSGAKWQLLVAHTKVGGFRQVVLKNGKLIFARLAQPIGENLPEVIAGNIEQEISVTAEYLKRLGYTDDQGLDVYVITGEAIKAAIDSKSIRATSAAVYSPYDVAQLIGMPEAAEQGDQFADVLMAAVFAATPKHLLRLQSERQKQLNSMYDGIRAAKVGGTVVTLGAIAASAYFGVLIPGAQDEIESYQQQIRMADQDMEKIREEEGKLPDSLEKMTDLVSVHKQLNNMGYTPDQFLHQLAALQNWQEKVLLRDVDWLSEKNALSSGNSAAGGFGNTDVPPEELLVKLTLDMYGTQVGSRAFNIKIDALTDQLQKIFPGYEVKLTGERPGNYNKTTDFSLDEESRDPIFNLPYYSVVYELKATSETINAAQQNGNGDGNA
jgi:hypothetical protein